jgi:hypothetical protein
VEILTMRARLSSPPAMLAAATLSLSATLTYQVLAPIAEYDVPEPAPRVLPAKTSSIPPFSAPTFSEFAEAEERPLFVPERRRPKTASETEEEKPRARPDVVLIGIILDETRKIAVVKREGLPALRLTIGAMLDGWEVTAIEAGHIALKAGSDTYEIVLPKPAPTHAPQTLARIPPSSPSRPGPPPGFARPPIPGR